MSRPFRQAIIGLLFLGQLVAVWALNREVQPGGGEDLGAQKALSTYGFYLTEAAREHGLDFKHENAQEIDQELHHILPLIASMGASVSVVDFDRDGLLDIFVVTAREGGKNKLFRNLG